jgi:hypothetical protein
MNAQKFISEVGPDVFKGLSDIDGIKKSMERLLFK